MSASARRTTLSTRPTRRTFGAVAAIAALTLTISACGDDGGSPGTDGAEGGEGESGHTIAAMFSGPTNDADYNYLGLLALQAAEEDGASIFYTETVAVPDVEARLNEAVGDGATIVWTHGSQFYDATVKVATNNPDVVFVAEYDGIPENKPDNVWTIDRNFHLGFYGMGILASELSESNKVGYVGGLSLPFSMAEVHAMEQAIADSGSSTELIPVWTGDFNDASKAQQFTRQLLGQGADVIVGSLNQGATGTFQAFEGREAGDGWVTAKYTNKSAAAGDHYAGSVVYDFVGPLADIIAAIDSGETNGHYPLGFDTGVAIVLADSVPAEVKSVVEDTVEKVKSGEIEVALDTTPIG